MKKFSMMLSMFVLALYSVFAVPTPIPTENLNNSGPWNPDAVENSMNFPINHDNDYSFDFATGEYKIFIVCELIIQNKNGNIYIGWINPDGSKILGTGYSMTFEVRGANGWRIESNGKFGNPSSTSAVVYAIDEQTGLPTNNVFITGSFWKWNNSTIPGGAQFTDYLSYLSGTINKFGGTQVNPGTYGSLGDGYDIIPTNLKYTNNKTIVSKWEPGVPKKDKDKILCQDEFSNACDGAGTFKLTPGTVWASPDATEGFYTFPVYIDVDYLTFDNEGFYSDYKTTDVNGDPSNYVFGNAGLPTP